MATRDDEAQARIAVSVVAKAEAVAISLPCILEFVWVLESVYAFRRGEVADAVLTLLRMENVAMDSTAVDAGIKVHAAGGDFADGVIASAGATMGAETFVSFDRKAITHIRAIGMRAELASSMT